MFGIFPVSAMLKACANARTKEAADEMAGDEQDKASAKAAREGRLTARPSHVKETAHVGLSPLGLDKKRDGFLYVPAQYQSNRPAPLVVMLHGAGGNAQGALRHLRSLADSDGFILLAPESRRATWDIILDSYGEDVTFINRALKQTFALCAVDTKRLAIGGFSDGATYALSLGLTNGDLFTHIIAFSPGFASPASRHGKPRIFMSHGTRDEVLPINRTSRDILPRLRQAGYDVRYREFDGTHTVPTDIAREAVDWFKE
jgi:predicted esterase